MLQLVDPHLIVKEPKNIKDFKVYNNNFTVPMVPTVPTVPVVSIIFKLFKEHKQFFILVAVLVLFLVLIVLTNQLPTTRINMR